MADIDRTGAAAIIVLLCLGVFWLINGDPDSWALGIVVGVAICWGTVGRRDA